ncbi:MAG: hypothetical protein NC433_15775 [Clostridiales bacterium]|nr:hypothetical protein [Clostridiales bacterium]
MAYRQKKLKYNVIRNAADLFGLDEYAAETLANSAGLSLKECSDFNRHLVNLIREKSKHKKLYEYAQISERMFQRIKNGRKPTKESLIAISVSLGLGLNETKELINMAGYALSDSIAWDAVIKTLIFELENTGNYEGSLIRINDVLYDMGLPLLMTREKI